MASDERSLLMTIAANHDEDTLRLVYADWLDENATPDNSHAARAQLIRTQISILRGIDVATGVPLTPELTAAFTAHENELLAAHRIEWEAEIHQALGSSYEEVSFHRGFPHKVRVSGVLELIFSRILESNTNTLTVLTVSNIGDQLPELLSYPGIVRLSTLNLRGNGIGTAGARAIAHSPYLANLTMLDLGNNKIRTAGARAIAHSPYLANLTMLDLGNNNIRDGGVEAIAASPYLQNLTTLQLDGNNIGTVGAEAIAASQYLVNLTTFDLWNNIIRDAGAVAIAASPNLSLSAKVYALQSTGFKTLAEQVQRVAEGRYDGRQ